jgi:hypothetical protein
VEREMEFRGNCERIYVIAATLLISASLIIMEIQVSAFAQQPQGVAIKLNSAYFTSPSGDGNHQVKVVTNYTVSNSSLVGQKINAVMKVYTQNGTLLKTTSYPDGFVLNNTGVRQLLTNLPNSTINNITAVATFTNLAKTVALSNPLEVPLNLGQSKTS